MRQGLGAISIDPATFAEIRLRTIFDCCKWDPQVEDVAALSRTAVVIDEDQWHQVAVMAEALDSEALNAETELFRRPDLHGRLGLPRAVRAAFRRAAGKDVHSKAVRCSRYDFHETAQGWRISEVNSDVPGGFIEAAGFTSLVAAALPQFRTTGDPAEVLAHAIGRRIDPAKSVALVHATAYVDDRQVMVFLSRKLEAAGLRVVLAAPDHLEWREGGVRVAQSEIGAIVRFFPGEWLANLPRRPRWDRLVRDEHVTLTNPLSALLTQSKRFPLVWDSLRTPLPTWRRLLPQTRAAHRSDRRGSDEWVLKPALGRVGDGIGIRGVTREREWKAIRRSVFWRPDHWIAQRRFDPVGLDTHDGMVYPAMGVFVIDGRAAGVYARLAARPLVDHSAMDAAVLVRPAAAGARRFREVHHDDRAAVV